MTGARVMNAPAGKRFDGMHRAMNGYLGDWRPASTTYASIS